MAETKQRDAMLLLSILLLGTLLRLPGLGDSFYGDEGFSLLRDSRQLITNSEDRFRPVFFSLLYLWRSLGFTGEVGLRLLPLLFGVAQIPLAFAVGRRIRDVRLGTAFALIMALSPMAIEFSQELRMYSLVAFLALLQIWLWLRIREQPARVSLGLWVAFVVTALAGVYTHLHYWLFLGGFVLTFIRERNFFKLGTLALSVVLLLYLPNWPNIRTFMAIRGGEYAVHLPSALPKIIAAFTAGFNYLPLPEQGLGRAMGVSNLVSNLPLVIILLTWLLLTLWGVVRLHGRAEQAGLWLCYELILIPVLLALIASLLTGKYWLQPKYLIFSLPPALLLIAQALLSLDKRGLRIAFSAAMFAVFTVSFVHWLDPVHYGRRENWRDAAAILKSRMNDQSAFIMTSLPRLFDYYWPEAKERARVVSVSGIAEREELAELLKADLAGKREVLYLRWDTAQNLDDPRDLLPAALDQFAVREDTIQLNPRLLLLTWRQNG